jgi:ketosteroid isomerase-like protein
MDATLRNKEAARRFVEGMGQDFVRAIDDAMAEDCRIVTMGTTPISGERGKAEALEAAALVIHIFPKGLPTVIHSMTAEDNRVAVEAESFATHVSGKPYNNKYLFLMRFRDGKLIELKEYLDTELAAKFFGPQS